MALVAPKSIVKKKKCDMSICLAIRKTLSIFIYLFSFNFHVSDLNGSIMCREAQGYIASVSISKPSSQDDRFIPATAAVYRAEVWNHFGFHCKETSKKIDKSHAVCKLSHAKIQYSRNALNLNAHLTIPTPSALLRMAFRTAHLKGYSTQK